jgi:acetyl esterase/lipase
MNLKVKTMIIIFMVFLSLGLLFSIFIHKTEHNASLIRYVDPLFEKVNVDKNIEYKEVVNSKGVNEKLLLDIYQPVGDKEVNRPAIVWIHGGGFNSGTKDYGFEQDLAMDFTKKGYVCVSINYRLRDENDHNMEQAINNAMDDAGAAVAWLENNSAKYQIDKQHIALGGHSAGAATAVNMTYMDNRNNNWPKKDIFAVIDLAGGRVYADHFDQTDPPALIIHGTEDTFVPYQDSENFAHNLGESKIPYTFYAVTDGSHFLVDQLNEVEDSITPFLYKQLTSKEVADDTTRSVENW